jgi:hypothetical protein
MKKGDKVWVRATVGNADADRPGWFNFWFTGNNGIYLPASDCRPVEPDQDDHPVEFKVGDRVVSWSGRKGIVEAINEIEGFPITVRHSMREQVSYKLGGVKHDETTRTSDPVNPSHYKQGPIECIEAIKAALRGGFTAYLWGNILKYTWRWPSKNGIEDLKKARWYLDRLIKEVSE